MSARMLVIMGSGETAPTMREVHASALARLSPASTAVLLDTPYGFQENAADISARAVEYFATSVGATLSVASWRSRDEPPLVREQALAAIPRRRLRLRGTRQPDVTRCGSGRTPRCPVCSPTSSTGVGASRSRAPRPSRSGRRRYRYTRCTRRGRRRSGARGWTCSVGSVCASP